MKTEKMCLWCKEIFTYKDWSKKTVINDLVHWEMKKYCTLGCGKNYNYYKCSKDDIDPNRSRKWRERKVFKV